MPALIFMDTETSGLSLDDDIWEFAAIRREEDGTETEHHLFIEHDHTKCANLPDSFRADHERRWPTPRYSAAIAPRAHAALAIHNLTSDRPHIAGAVPNFDTERIALLLRRFGYEPGWHHHLIDVENLAVGYLAGAGQQAVNDGMLESIDLAWIAPPWNSDDLSRAVGVEPPGEGVRHTAMGDTRWVRALYDRIMCRPVSHIDGDDTYDRYMAATQPRTDGPRGGSQ